MDEGEGMNEYIERVWNTNGPSKAARSTSMHLRLRDVIHVAAVVGRLPPPADRGTCSKPPHHLHGGGASSTGGW